jgi:hypothetical protein
MPVTSESEAEIRIVLADPGCFVSKCLTHSGPFPSPIREHMCQFDRPLKPWILSLSAHREEARIS